MGREAAETEGAARGSSGQGQDRTSMDRQAHRRRMSMVPAMGSGQGRADRSDRERAPARAQVRAQARALGVEREWDPEGARERERGTALGREKATAPATRRNMAEREVTRRRTSLRRGRGPVRILMFPSDGRQSCWRCSRVCGDMRWRYLLGRRSGRGWGKWVAHMARHRTTHRTSSLSSRLPALPAAGLQ